LLEFFLREAPGNKPENLKEYQTNAKPIARWGRKATGLEQAEIAGLPEKVTRFFIRPGASREYQQEAENLPNRGLILSVLIFHPIPGKTPFSFLAGRGRGERG